MNKKCFKSIIYTTIILTVFCRISCQAQETLIKIPSNEEKKTKRNIAIVLGSEAVALTASMTGLYYLWYADYEQEPFHFYNDNGEWLQMDKYGHAFSTYTVGLYGYELLKAVGMKETPAIICGGSLGFVFLGIVEVFDGMSSGWGFSWGDMAANTFGTALFMSQQLLWHEQKITMKYSFHQTKYSQYRPDLLGSNIIENSIKDYNGMTIWLSFNIKSLILKKDSKFPSWINVAIGLGADGMTGAFENVSSHNGIPVPEYQRCRQFYISPDIDLTRIPTNNKFLKTTLKILNFIKIPLPALEYNTNGNFVWHWIYF